MNLKYLGDALDHWKGSVFDGLQTARMLERFHVDAMATDAKDWKSADWKLFARLLRIQESQILRHDVDLRRDRAKYFAEIPPEGDLFLDPDTGVKTGKVKDVSQYLTPKELFATVGDKSNRVVVVYQHVRAKRTRDRLEEVLEVLRQVRSRFFCASYESGTVALMFVSLSHDRVAAIRKYFHHLLGSHATNRIGFWK